jgi:hypothetical protein
LPGVLHAHRAVERYRVNRRYESLMRALEARDAQPAPRAA